METLTVSLRMSMKRWCTRTPLASIAVVMPVASWVLVLVIVPALGSASIIEDARATSAVFSGVTLKALRPRSSSSASLGADSLLGRVSMKRTFLGSKRVAKVEFTSSMVIVGSTARYRSSVCWAPMVGSPLAMSLLMRPIKARAGRVFSRSTESSAPEMISFLTRSSSRCVKPWMRARWTSAPSSASISRHLPGSPLALACLANAALNMLNPKALALV